MKFWNKVQSQVAEKPQELVFAIVFTSLTIMLIVVGLVVLNKFDFNKKDTASTPKSEVVSTTPEFKAIKSRESQGATRSGTLTTDLMEKNSSGVSGVVLFVEFTEPKDQVFIGLELRGKLEESPYPAYIYKGSCDKPERQLYSLSHVVNGKTENYLTGSLPDFRKQFPLALRVQKLANQDLSNDIACADLK